MRRAAHRWRVMSAFGGALLASCTSKPQSTPHQLADASAKLAAPKPADATPPDASLPTLPPARAPKAGDEVSIGAGTLKLGSPTGAPGRNPAREADDVAVPMTSFLIDALPYPNDPEKAPRHSITREEANALCKEQGKRLCSELEWERACKGDLSAEHPSRVAFDAAQCESSATSCASVTGVFAMGTLGREWTASDAKGGDLDPLRTAITRGAGKDASANQHRCAARDSATPRSRSDSLIFRCCRGAEQSASYPAVPDFPAFREGAVSATTVREALAAMPETAALREGFRPFQASQMMDALKVAGRSQSSLAPWQAIQGPLLWSPVPGEELVVVSGDTARGAVVIAYYPLPQGQYRFAASYETRGEHTPVLIAYKADVRDELLYSTCWGCGGEGGALRLDDDSRVRFLPR